MGDITGRPKTPSPQVVYVPQYVYENKPSANTSAQESAPSSSENPSETTPAQQREKSLLGRSRSRVGTILTGFRGILAPIETAAPRKTLLGE